MSLRAAAERPMTLDSLAFAFYWGKKRSKGRGKKRSKGRGKKRSKGRKAVKKTIGGGGGCGFWCRITR